MLYFLSGLSAVVAILFLMKFMTDSWKNAINILLKAGIVTGLIALSLILLSKA